MPLKEIIRPTRLKLIVVFLIPMVYFLFILAANAGFRNAFIASDAITQSTGVLASILLGALIYYPLSCGAVFLYGWFSGGDETKEDKKTEKKPDKKDLFMAVILIIVFNPLTYSLIFAASNYVNLNVLHTPCGVEVMGYTEISPARDSYMVAGEVITMVDGQKTGTTAALTNILSQKSPNDSVIVQTNVRTYSIKLAEDPQTNRAILGIITSTLYCVPGQETNQSPQYSVPPEALNACMASCIHTRDAGDTMDNGPCILDPIPVQPDWVCDIVHNPRSTIDNQPDNQCSFYRDGKSGHFIELDTQCNLVRAV